MKKIFNSLFVIIASMVAFAACVKEENSPASETKTVQFFAESIETKTHFDAPVSGKYPTLWDEGDKVKILLNLESPSGVGNLEKTVTISEISTDLKSASFKAELNTEYSFPSYTFYAVVPSTAYNAKSSTDGRFTVLIPADQTPQNGSVDKAAQVLYAVSETSSTMPSSVPMTFKHYTAYGKLSLSNLTSKISTVSSITLESAGAGLAGKWNYFVADGSVAAREGTDKLTLTTSATENIWFACAPVDMSGKELILTVNTDKGPLSKTITFPANRKFESGKISVFTVDMAGIEPEEPSESSQYYVKVTEEQNDWSGKYLIVFGNNAHATLSSKDLNSTCSVTIVDDKIAATDALASAVMTVTKSGEKYHMTFADGKYFGMQHNGCLLMTSAFDLDFEYTSSGVKISGYVSAKSATYILYNNSNQYYRCYVDKNGQSGYTLPTLYKLEAESEGGETPEDYLTVSETEIDVNADATSASFTVSSNLEWTATSDDAEVTVDGSTVNVSFESNDSEEAKVYTVTVSAAGVESAIVKINQAGKIDVSDVPVGIKAIYSAIKSEASATPDAFEVALTDAVVTYVNGNSAFVEDETAGILIYKSSHGLVAGDKLNGVLTGKGYIRYGVCQITEFDLTNITKETGAEIPVVEITVADLLNDYASYVSRRIKIVDATVTDGVAGASDKNGAVKQNGSAVNLYNNNSTVNFVETEVVDFYAYPSYYSTTKQLATWESPTTKKVATPVITCNANVVTISCGTSGASVYYAIGNGEFAAYPSAGIAIDATVTVKAYATKSGLATSETASFECEYVDLGSQPETVEASLSFANKAQRTSQTTSQQTWEQNGIKLVNDKASSSNNVADYANPARFYKDSKLTISAPGNITKIEFTCNSSSYATALKSSIASGGTVTVSGSKVTVVLSAPATSFVVAKLSDGQVRMNSLKVTYEK